ncbi:MAG: M15 family metallopeptidase [Clostridia bacterium]|nr:M15 family metallopeptidase [Clostridia bacterium]
MDSEKDKKNPEITEKDGITYVNGILIANKSYSLPKTYSPGIDTTANNALQQMFSAASNAGISLYVVSGFRSYDTQYNTYYGYVSRSGQADADRYSARPGHSEHQTGLAFDLNSLEQTFGNTKEGKWLKANAHKYGFIIRYPEGKESVTGYMYEPWHVRYLGTDIATDVFESGLCLEEYLGITSVYNN